MSVDRIDKNTWCGQYLSKLRTELFFERTCALARTVRLHAQSQEEHNPHHIKQAIAALNPESSIQSATCVTHVQQHGLKSEMFIVSHVMSISVYVVERMNRIC